MRRQFQRFRRPVRVVAVVFGMAAWLSAQAPTSAGAAAAGASATRAPGAADRQLRGRRRGRHRRPLASGA